MTIYRKRGTEVDAFQWTADEHQTEDPAWICDLLKLDKARIRNPGPNVQMFLDPPSGKGAPLVANVGDWIVRNARGDVFPMTAAKFAETYEATDRDHVLAALADAFGEDGDFFVRDVRAAFDGEKIR